MTEQQLDTYYSPRSMGELFGEGFDLLKRTLPTSGLLTVAVMLPLGLVMALLTESMMEGVLEVMQQMIQSGADADSAELEQEMNRMMQQRMGLFMLLNGLQIVFAVAVVVVQTAIVYFSWQAAIGREVSLVDGVMAMLRGPAWFHLLQLLIIVACVIGGMIVLGIALAVLVAIAGSISDAASSFAAVFGMLAIAAIVAYLSIATIFRVHTIVIDGDDAWKSLLHSYRITRGQWWRAFLFTLALMAALAVVSLVLMIPFILMMVDIMSQLIAISAADTADTAADIPMMIFEMYSSMFSPLYFTLMMLVSAIAYIVLYTMLTPLYLDMKRLAGEPVDDEDGWGKDEG